MKKLIALTAIAAACSTSAFAGNFEGWSVTAAVEQAKSALNGGPVMNADGTPKVGSYGAQSLVEGSETSTGLKLGVAYGLPIGPTLTTFGVDYSTASSTIHNAGAAAGVQNPDPTSGIFTEFKNRTDVYVAPGFLLNTDSLIYGKVGYSTFTASAVDKGNGVPVGSAGKTGTFYGIGYKQMLDKNSPYFFTAEYITGKTKDDTVSDPTGSIHVSGLNNKFSSISFGIGYSFK